MAGTCTQSAGGSTARNLFEPPPVASAEERHGEGFTHAEPDLTASSQGGTRCGLYTNAGY